MSVRLVVLLALLGCGAPDRTPAPLPARAEVASAPATGGPSARLVRRLWQLVITGNPGGGTLRPWSLLGFRDGAGLVTTGNPGGSTLRPGCGPGLVITGNPGGDTLRPWCQTGR